MTINDNDYQKIESLSEQGNAKIELGLYTEAIELFNIALEIVPKPLTDWEASTWLLASIGDCHFALRQYPQALDAFQGAIACPTGTGNPFIHLRLGEIQFELDNHERALDELTRAYALEGEEMFGGEDNKYLAFLKATIQM